MKVDNMRAELMKLYPDSTSWKYKCTTWPDNRIKAVFLNCKERDIWNKKKKERELAKQQKASSSYYHQMDMFELNMLVIGGNND